MELALNRAEESGIRADALRARALGWAAKLAGLCGEGDRAVALFEQALADWRALNDPAEVARVLDHLGELERERGHYERSSAVLTESLNILRQLGDELERDALQPLPPTRYEIAPWKPAKVNIDYHVEYDTRFYSVPHRLVHEPVEVRATAAVVEIFHRSRRVASHVREYGRKRFITEPDHMPAAHRAHMEWTPSKLIAWGPQRRTGRRRAGRERS